MLTYKKHNKSGKKFVYLLYYKLKTKIMETNMIEMYNTFVAPVIPYILGIVLFLFVIFVYPSDGEDGDFICDM